jgi:alpha-L-rhamnosidase
MRFQFIVGLALLVTVATLPLVARASSNSLGVLRVEYADNPIGIDVTRPRFSWQLLSSARGVAQTAYQIRVARDEKSLRDGLNLLWDSGKLLSDESIQHVYQGPSLQSRQRYYWQVRVWDEHGIDLGWSAVAHWEMGLLSPQNWTAKWIAAGAIEDTRSTVPPIFRHEFSLGGAIKSARIYATSHGLYQLALNGQPVTEDVLTPGWTSYNHRLQYQIYDVSDKLKNGVNAIGASLGNGWFKGVVGFEGKADHYGDQLALLLQLEVTFVDGHTETIVSNESWKSSTGPIVMSEIYDGETYDARLERAGWTSPGYDDHEWARVQTIDAAKEVLIAPEGPPVRRVETLVPKRIFTTPGGDTVVDFGQNMVGWVRLKVQGPAGTTVTLRHAEVLDRDGNFYTENLRAAKATVQYILKGKGLEIFEPHFTFQGFRYVAVEGYPGKLKAADLAGVVVHSDMARTGEFATSKSLINQLQHNIIWGQKGNFVDVPTDCPQRDERLGWTGDAEVFSSTAAFNMDVAGFFTKWLKDLTADQLSTGSVPFVVPDILSTPLQPAAGAAGWGDAATVIPWNLYLAYGDLRILEQQYSSMQKWVDYEQARAGADNIWDGDTHFGDWLDFFSTAKNTRFGSTSTDLIATAYFAHSTDILQRSAALLGKADDAARYSASLAKIKEAFRRNFIAADGTIAEGTQTAYVISLDFDLVPISQQADAAQKLVQDVRERGHLTTGFLGTPHLLNILSRYGYLKEAYGILNREEFPSWLYPVKKGATTIWERWDGIKPDGSFENKDMNSFNHYAYGAVGDWMYKVIGGINIDSLAPGYKHILISPQPGGGFTSASTSHASPYGTISTDWKLSGHNLRLIVVIPPNTTATIRLPNADIRAVSETGKLLSAGSEITSVRQDGPTGVVEIGSGRYQFEYPIVPNLAPTLN